jgi:hypothetical protein
MDATKIVFDADITFGTNRQDRKETEHEKLLLPVPGGP